MSHPASLAFFKVSVSTCDPYATTFGLGEHMPASFCSSSKITKPGFDKSTMTHRGDCSRARVNKISDDRAALIDRPRSRAVPTILLEKIISSDSNNPHGTGVSLSFAIFITVNSGA